MMTRGPAHLVHQLSHRSWEQRIIQNLQIATGREGYEGGVRARDVGADWRVDRSGEGNASRDDGERVGEQRLGVLEPGESGGWVSEIRVWAGPV